jgi:hypothetical protein
MDFSLFSSCYLKFVNSINILRFLRRFSYQRSNRQRCAACGSYPVAQSISGVRKLYKKIRQINRLLWSECPIHLQQLWRRVKEGAGHRIACSARFLSGVVFLDRSRGGAGGGQGREQRC